MIRKYRYGTPFDTEALTEKIETTESAFPYGEISQNDGFAFTYIMDEDDIVYGLGESNRGINKRGYCYISNCTLLCNLALSAQMYNKVFERLLPILDICAPLSIFPDDFSYGAVPA